MNTAIISAELIPITEYHGRRVASMRDLHTFLDVSRDFTTWAQQMFEYGFTEHEDYAEVFPEKGENPNGGRPRRDWAVTMDMGKEISMIQRTDRGKQARQYFIEAEKRSQAEVSLPRTLPEALRQYANEVEAHESTRALVAVMEPKAAAWDTIVSSKGSWSYNDAAKVLCDEGEIEIGEKRLAQQLVDWGYLYRDSKKRPHVYQQYIQQGLFTVKARTYEDKITGEIKESSAPQVRITGKGLGMIRTRLLTQKEAA